MDASRYKRRVPARRVNDVDFGISGVTKRSITRRVNAKIIRSPKVISEMAKTQALPQPIIEVAAKPTEATKPAGVIIDMRLPGGPSRINDAEPIIKTKRSVKIKRIALKSLGVLIIVGLIAGAILFSRGYIKIHQAFNGSATSAVSLKTNVDPNLLKGEGDGRINILLLGRGGGNHDAPDLTDTMILASIDPVNKKATLISIPRDLWVDVQGQGKMKINAAWETGEFKYLGRVVTGSTDPRAIQAGFDLVDKTVSATFGVPINYNAIVDFQAFKQAVDTVGGVTVNVPEDLYDPNMAWENHNNPLLAKAGTQQFNGTQALIYVRSRESTSDFARSLRQRTLMIALKGKVDSLGTLSNPVKIAGLINAFGNNVSTDLSIQDASKLYAILKDVTDTNVSSIGLADPPNRYVTTGPMNGQSIDLPTAGLFNYADIQSFIRTQLKDGHITQENAKIQVMNGTIKPELTTKFVTALGTYGYNVIGTGTTPTIGYSKTSVIDLGRQDHPYTKNYLEKRFGVTATTQLPDISINANGADFVIIIGEDEIISPKI
jgi:LCP family protein required for cell wall assembly